MGWLEATDVPDRTASLLCVLNLKGSFAGSYVCKAACVLALAIALACDVVRSFCMLEWDFADSLTEEAIAAIADDIDFEIAAMTEELFFLSLTAAEAGIPAPVAMLPRLRLALLRTANRSATYQ